MKTPYAEILMKVLQNRNPNFFGSCIIIGGFTLHFLKNNHLLLDDSTSKKVFIVVVTRSLQV